jgi:hypothetical protein
MYMPKPGADFEPPPAGAHVAVCFRILDLGTQTTNFQGQVSHKHQIMISWELPEEKMADDRPFSISKKYTYSGHKKATLRTDLESWRGVPFTDADFGTFDLAKLLGAGCQLNIVHKTKDGSTFAKITALMRLPKGVKAPPTSNPKINLVLQPGEFDRVIYEGLSERMREIIASSPEYQTLSRQGDGGNKSYRDSVDEELDDEIPF